MLTHFCEQLATELQELDVPVFIENLAYWIRKNAANNKHLHEGRYWSYNSYPAFAKLYPFWSAQTIRRIIKRAVNAGLLIIGNFNVKKYDNTNWYTLTDKALAFYPALHGLILHTPVDSDSTPVDFDRPIPTLLSSSSKNTITTSESSDSPSVAPVAKKSKNAIDFQELIDIYAKWFPDNPQPYKKSISTILEKTIRTLVKRWPEAHPENLAFTSEQFDRYMESLSSTAPKFSKGSYITEHGNKKKNNMVTFCRWDTFIQFLEGKYS